jgi:DNA repair protein SbcD/Mre11
MRAIHTGDWHLTDGPRFADTMACLDFLVAHGIEGHTNLWLVGGDLTGTTVPHVATIAERLGIARILQAMAAHAPVVLVYGNHDYPGDLDIYGRLRAAHPINVVARPQTVEVAGARVWCLPYPSKRWFVGAGTAGALVAQKAGLEEGLRAILADWRRTIGDARAQGLPTLALLHVHIGGAAVGGGEVILIGQEVELAPHDLRELGADHVALAHIHRAQQIADTAWYAGSPSAQNHGEWLDVKGFLVVDIEAGRPHVAFVRTPARPLRTLDVRWTCRADADGDDPWTYDRALAGQLTGAEVRVRVTLAEQDAATCPLEELATLVRDQFGAARVILDPPRIIPRSRQRLDVALAGGEASGILDEAQCYAHASLADKLRLYWKTCGAAVPDDGQQARCLTQLAALQVGE